MTEPSTKRSVPEWVGASPDSAIPLRVKLRIWNRCGGRCALTGKKIMPGELYDFDHTVALANGGLNAESNLRLVSRQAHREKTKADVAEKAKTDRMRMKHLGIRKPPTMGHPRLKRRFDGTVVERDA